MLHELGAWELRPGEELVARDGPLRTQCTDRAVSPGTALLVPLNWLETRSGSCQTSLLTPHPGRQPKAAAQVGCADKRSWILSERVSRHFEGSWGAPGDPAGRPPSSYLSYGSSTLHFTPTFRTPSRARQSLLSGGWGYFPAPFEGGFGDLAAQLVDRLQLPADLAAGDYVRSRTAGQGCRR